MQTRLAQELDFMSGELSAKVEQQRAERDAFDAQLAKEKEATQASGLAWLGSECMHACMPGDRDRDRSSLALAPAGVAAP